MIKAVRKVVQIGSSAGVTIPALEMAHEGIQIGDEVKITIQLVQNKNPSREKLLQEYELFKTLYGETLEKLAK